MRRAAVSLLLLLSCGEDKGSSSSVAESSLGFRAERRLHHVTMLKNI